MAPPPAGVPNYGPGYPTQSASELTLGATQLRADPPMPYQSGSYQPPTPATNNPTMLKTVIVVMLVILGAVLVSLLWTKMGGSGGQPQVVVTVTAGGGTNKPDVPPPNQPPAEVDDVSPPNGAIYLDDRLAKANNDATDGFCRNVADAVRATRYSPGDSFMVGAWGLNNSKYYEIDCRASKKAGSWVVCGGGNTRGNVQIFVRP